MARTLHERSVELVKQSALSERNKELLLRFTNECLATGLGQRRIAKYLWQLRNVGRWLGTDFDKATAEDIKRLVAGVETTSLADWTKCDYRVTIRRFYKWLLGGNDYPDCVRWIKTRRPRGRHVMPSDLLTEDDVRRLVAAADHPRDRALVACLYDPGRASANSCGCA